MTTDRKIQSNRKNAQRSTGPRSAGGRQVSRRNALRHGLAIAVGLDPSFSAEIEALASAIGRAAVDKLLENLRGSSRRPRLIFCAFVKSGHRGSSQSLTSRMPVLKPTPSLTKASRN
jgi:hypothetical protein